MAIVLDTAGKYLTYTGTVIDARNDYTWMAWVRTTISGAWQGVLSFSIGEGSTQYETTEIQNTNDWGLYAMDGQTDAGGSISIFTWYHVAMVKSGTTLSLYIGGTLVNTITGVTDVNLTHGVMIWGRWSLSDDQFYGWISYSRAWTSALTPTQILTESASTTPVVTANLWGDWPLQTNGNDASGNGRNLTSNGSVTWDTSNEPITSGPASISFTDIGTGTDANQISVTLSTDDSGSGLDDLPISTLVSFTDILTALAETVSGSVLVTWIDALLGVDADSVIAQLKLIDAPISNDSENIDVSLGIVDTGALEDVYGAIASVLTILESANASDTHSASVSTILEDIGLGLESASFNITAYFQDTFTGDDLFSVLTQIFKTVTDNLSGSDTISQLTVYFSPIADSGLFYDTDRVLVNLAFTEAGLGTDSISILSGTFLTILDDMVGLENMAIQASVPISDEGFSVDELLFAYYLAIIDSGVLEDSGLTITVFLPLTDLGAAVEVSNILSSIAFADSGSLVDFSTKFDSATKKLVAQVTFSRRATGLQLTKPENDVVGSGLSANIDFQANST